MKVYGCPDECPAPKVDYQRYDHAKVMADEAAHQEALKKWLIEAGYKGKNTGKVASFGVADGRAQYMLAEGSKSCLIHLPYGDAYQLPHIERLTKGDILKRAKADEGLASIFAEAKAS